MALYTNLPVYKLSYDTCITIHHITQQFPKAHKYTLGSKLKNVSINLITFIYKANKNKKDQRLLYINNAREDLETLRILLRLSKDLNVIGGKTFADINFNIEQLSKQLTSWQKYTVRATT